MRVATLILAALALVFGGARVVGSEAAGGVRVLREFSERARSQVVGFLSTIDDMKITLTLIGLVLIGSLVGCEKRVHEARLSNVDQMALAR